MCLNVADPEASALRPIGPAATMKKDQNYVKKKKKGVIIT